MDDLFLKRLPDKVRKSIGNQALKTFRQYITGGIDYEAIKNYVLSIWDTKGSANKGNYGALMMGLKGARETYDAIYKKYSDALSNGENLIGESELRTTRANINSILPTRLQIAQDESFGDFANRLRDIYATTANEMDKVIIQTVFESFPDALGLLSNELTGWRKRVNDVIQKFKSKNGGAVSISEVGATDQISDMVEKWKKDLDETQTAISRIPIQDKNSKEYKNLTARQSLLQQISEILYGNKTFDGTTKQAKSDARDAKAELRQQIADIKQEYQNLQELKRWYDKFKGIDFDDDAINKLLMVFYGRGIPEGGFASAFESIAMQLEGNGATNDARDVRNFAAGRDINKDYDEAKKKREDRLKEMQAFQKRLEQYQKSTGDVLKKIDYLEEQQMKDIELVSTYEELEIVTAHYTEEIDKLKESLTDLTSIQLTDFWQQLTGEKNGTYLNLTKLQKKAGELIDALKSPDVKTNRNKEGKITSYNLSRDKFGSLFDSLGISGDTLQLTIGQVEELNKAFESLFGIRAKKNGIFAFFDAISNKNYKTFWKDLMNGSGPAMSTIEEANKQLSTLGGIFKEIGDAIDSQFLSGFGETLSFMGDFFDKLLKGDLLGAIGSVISSVFSWIGENHRLAQSIHEAADEAERLKAASKLERGVDTVFGENSAASVRNALELMRKYKALADKDKGSKSIEWKTGLFHLWTEDATLSNMVRELGYDLYDAYGNLNAEALQAILDTYENLTNADRKWIEDAITHTELYAEAADQLKQEMQGVWGGIADDLTDKLINARKEVGDAYHALADDMRGTFGDVAEDIARKLISSFILDNIISKYEYRLKPIYDLMGKEGEEENIVAQISSLAEDIISESGKAAELTNRIYDAMDRYNLTSEENTNTISNGIKSITEDTANLLASYLNGIRADVSYGKVQWERIAVAVEGQGARYITLNDYMMQVQANTANIAESNRRILERMEGFIRDFSLPSGYGESLKVQIVN